MFIKQLKEVSLSVFSITLIVLILHFTIAPLENETLLRFLLGAVIISLGLGIFLFGANLGITPIGSLMGETIAKSNKVLVVGILGFLLGFMISAAEPDLQILARQVDMASGGKISGLLFLVVVSAGLGLMVAIGLFRILFEKPLNKLFTIVYVFIFFVALMASEEFLAFSVDASGATTGSMSTPFILALGYGVSHLKGGKTVEEDSFGMVGLASAGPIFAILLMGVLKKITNLQAVDEFHLNSGILSPYLRILPQFLKESVFTLLPLLILFIVFNFAKFKLNKRSRNSIYKGLLFTFVGLTLFMVGVNAGFMEAGRVIGEKIGRNFVWLLPFVGFFIGTVVVLAEPAVYVLTIQVEEVTAGHIKRKLILITLSIGIAFAICFSMLRIMIPALKLWHFLLPGFAFAAFLSYHVPPIFVGIAYDAGGVASGPMTATFVLAFAQGAAVAIPGANVLVDGFGVIAMVAMAPLVAIQILGMIFKIRSRRRLNDAEA